MLITTRAFRDVDRGCAAGVPFTYNFGFFEKEITKFTYQIIDIIS